MTDIEFEMDGFEKTRQRFEEIRDDYEGDGVVYIVGTTVEYGVILEFGRGPIRADDGYLRFENEDGDIIFRKEVSGHPPYPWFRPAIREFRANPEQFLLQRSEIDSIDEIQSTEQLVAQIAFALENQMTDNVSAQTASDRSPGTDPEHPQRETGNLANSIQAFPIN